MRIIHFNLGRSRVFSVKVYNSIKKSHNRYFHLPLLYFAWGTDGIIATILGISFLISWKKKDNEGTN